MSLVPRRAPAALFGATLSALCLSSCGGPGVARQEPTCRLSPLAVEEDPREGRLVARGSRVEISWEDPEPDVRGALFDGPFRVERSSPATRCSIDAGIWHRDHVYASEGETVVAAMDYADPDDGFVLYRTGTCERLARIGPPILDAEVQGNRIVQRGSCREGEAGGDVKLCQPARVFELSADCEPRRLEAESLALTREVFGVGFSTESRIEAPFTSGARLIAE